MPLLLLPGNMWFQRIDDVLVLVLVPNYRSDAQPFILCLRRGQIMLESESVAPLGPRTAKNMTFFVTIEI